MKLFHNLILLFPVCFTAGCVGIGATSDSSNVYQEYEQVANKPASEISREDGWTIVSMTEDGDRVYWFLAPDTNQVTPALFKKTIKTGEKIGHDTVIVSQCDAPKQQCDELMKKFESMNIKYK